MSLTDPFSQPLGLDRNGIPTKEELAQVRQHLNDSDYASLEAAHHKYMKANRSKTASVPVSPTLRAALRDVGWWKLAHAVKSAQGLAPPESPSLVSGVESLALKLAADRATLKQIRSGLEAYERLVGG